jgi:hypothetical protein
MAYNGSGTFQRLYNWVTDRTNSIKIRADRMDAEFDGIASGLSNAICKDGQTTITADIPFNNRKITGLADASASTDALNRQSGDARFLALIAGLTAETSIANADVFAMYDDSATAYRKVSYSSIKTALTTDFSADGRMFPVGTRMTFQQTTPPTGWTKEVSTTYADSALRISIGTVTTGGSTTFSTVFQSKTPSGSIGAITLSTGNLPSHTVDLTTKTKTGAGFVAGSQTYEMLSGTNDFSSTTSETSNSVGSGTSFTPTFTGNAMDFAVKFVDFTIGQKA